jgi:hypothetical protein
MCDKKLPTIIKGATGYISSYNIKRRLSRFGHRSCSYILEASPGQRWNLTLFDFGMRYNVLREPGRVHLGSIRHKYATVQETGSPPSDSRFIIGGEDREKSVYLSQKHRVLLEVYDTANEADARHFLIQYKGECHFHAMYQFLLINFGLVFSGGVRRSAYSRSAPDEERRRRGVYEMQLFWGEMGAALRGTLVGWRSSPYDKLRRRYV